MIRLLLKTLSLIQILEVESLRCAHFLLPDLLTLQNSLEAAVESLCSDMIQRMPAQPTEDAQTRLRMSISTRSDRRSE